MGKKKTNMSDNISKELVDSLAQNMAGMLYITVNSVAESYEKTFEIDSSKSKELKSMIIKNLSTKIGSSFGASASSIKVVSMDPSKSCMFKLIRGDRRGQECGKKTTKDSVYCSTHKKSQELKNMPTASVVEEISCTIYDKQPGMFIVENSDLIIGLKDPFGPKIKSNCEVLGFVSTKGIEPLDERHTKIAQRTGFSIAEL